MFENVGLIYDFVGREYNINHDLIAQKLRHTFRVYKLMVKLVERLDLNDHDKRLALYIALFHDLGRFYEIRKNNKFNNIYDHANDSVKILFDEGFIKEFLIDEEDYDLVKKAVFYHNKKELPKELSEREKFFCNLIRDVDKIDIIHVIAMEEKKSFMVMPSEVVLSNFYNRELIDLKDIKSQSDSIILYLAFQDQLVFQEAKDILYEKKYFEEFINSIKVKDDRLIKDIFDHIIEEAYSHRYDDMYQEKMLRKEVKYGRIREKI